MSGTECWTVGTSDTPNAITLVEHYFVTQLVSVVSRKTHGDAGTFEIGLPFTPPPPTLIPTPIGIECRSGGASNNFKLIFTFANPLVSVGSASVTSGTGSVSSSTPGPNSNQYTVDLTGVTNAQHVTLTLHNAVDSTGTNGDVSATMGVLIGDVNASGVVDGNDVSAVQSHTRQSAGNANFRYDVNASGLIDGNDVSVTQGQTRTGLP